jgi:hypothetical protein
MRSSFCEEFMKRSGLHNSLLLGVTAIFFGSILWLSFVERSIQATLVACAIYLGVLALVYLIAAAIVPRVFRKAPPMPLEFESLSQGGITSDISTLLLTAVSVEERSSRGVKHSLYRLRQETPSGVWICEVETAQDSIIALKRVFESGASQLFDTGSQVGEGLFIYTQTSDG